MKRTLTADDYATNRVVGRVLREVRKDRGWTLNDTEMFTGVAASVLGAYERGERTVTVVRMIDLCRVYEVSPMLLADVIVRRVTIARAA